MASQGEIDRERMEMILLPYQRRWVDDRSPLKIWLAARQIGKSFSVAMEAIAESLEGRRDNLILSSSERQSREVMQKVYSHLRYLRVRSEETIRAERESREEVSLPNGSRIISLPANPDTVRGFSGNVFLDEFAFHRDAREIWRAMYPAVTRGYRVRVTSTPNGRQNMFYGLWARDGRFSKHRVDIYQAAAEGLGLDVEELRLGMADEEAWAQEFECRFIDEATAFITYEMIVSCEDKRATMELNPSSLLPLDKGRMGGVTRELYLGVDIGRRKDLTVFWLLEEAGGVFWTRMVRELAGAPFSVQREFLYSLLEGKVFDPPHSPLNLRGDGRGVIRRACIDSSGLGAQLAEEAVERFGPRVEGVAFTARVKEDLAYGLRRLFEERTLRLPPERRVREDIHSVKKLLTPAGNARFDAGRNEGSHADRFWALALAAHAGARPGARPVYYEALAGRRFRVAGIW